MTVDLVAVVLAATEPEHIARFWAHALGGWDIRPADDHIALVPTDATSFGVWVRPGAGDKVGQNPMHFDLTTTSLDDQRRTVDELVAIGGSHIDIGQGPEDTHVVLADPDGNELCVIEPFNRFLAGCPRLGAVNCDGTRQLGLFFRDALGWPLVWDQDEETAIQAPDGNGPKITWSGPPLMPKSSRPRFHLHVAPSPGTAQDQAVEHLLALGASRRPVGAGCPGSSAVAVADVDGNDLCVEGATRTAGRRPGRASPGAGSA